MSKLTDQIDNDDIDVVRAVARELAKDLDIEKSKTRDTTGLAEILNRALKEEKQQREVERAMWREHVELLKATLKTSEEDVAACQQILKVAAFFSDTHLRFLMNWIWTRSTSQEIIDHRGSRDAIWQMIGMLQPFAKETSGE